jgi:formamidopyrimidine-DNA glycosylase
MPELPDVEVTKRYLNATSLHKEIEDVRVHHTRILKGISRPTLRKRLRHRKLMATRRHGKHLFAEISGDGWLMLHFGMTGFLRYFKRKSKQPDHIRMQIDFDNGYHLAYDNQRLLGQVGLIRDPQGFIEKEKLGPDAWEDLDEKTLSQRFDRRRGSLKSALMNQQVIAGIGNIYSDEILFQAGLHPKSRLADLTDKTLKSLYIAIQKVLRQAIEAGADPEQFPHDFLIPHRHAGGSCPQCGHSLKKIGISGRHAYVCTKCQSAAA